MSDKLIKLARPEVIAMSAYHSARSEQSANEASTKIWLDANENPWDDLQKMQYNRYPDPQPFSLVKCLSTLYGVEPEQLIVTRGSDEGIDLLVRLFCTAGKDNIMICPPTYGMYKVSAAIQNAGVIEVPLIKNNNFSLDLPKLLQTWQPTTKIIFLCSPNNPTGNLLSITDILSLCQELSNKSIIVVDEAYIEFSNGDSLAKYITTYPNLVVLRTLSKAYGLAGIRCGTTIANPNIIQLLKKILAPYPIPKPIVKIVCEQIKANEMKNQLAILNREKNKLVNFLSSLPFVKKVIPSQANFLLFEVTNATEIMQKCLLKNIVLRDRSRDFNLENCIRTTIGSPDENKLLMEALSNV